ncbi:MAG: Rieske (2Fe-2S) domain protein [Myxococcales bacterium]|nr:Rieske (2Fe-2S) domain protein [Myxococcales bacterium]
MMTGMRSCSRRQFHGLVLAGAGFAVLGCNQGAAPDGTVAAAMGRVTLPFAMFPKLGAVGGSVVVDVTGEFPIVVVRTSDTAATALSATCTHAACLVDYAAAANDLHCPCHDANFALDGSVKNGPTIIPLPVYPAQVGADAIVVNLT